jgi:tripartite-type tricarboxylate transporter receptor subunit TctC
MNSLKAFPTLKLHAVLCSLVMTLGVQAWSQSYPNKPLRVISEYVAGNGGDVFSRQILSSISAQLGQAIVVENKGGSGGLVAVEAARRASADGYTLLLASQNVPVTRRFLSKSEPIDPLVDLTPLSALWRTSLVIAVNPAFAPKTVKDLVEYAKSHAGQLSYSTTGIGTQGHFAGANFANITNTQLLHVPYNDNRLITDVISGELPMTIGIISMVAPHVKAGRLRLVASAGQKRSEMFPDVPTVSELMPNFEPPPTWTALFAPPGLPKPLLDKLAQSIGKALAAPELRANAASDGFDLIGNSPDEFILQIKKDIEIAGRLVKTAKIEPTD